MPSSLQSNTTLNGVIAGLLAVGVGVSLTSYPDTPVQMTVRIAPLVVLFLPAFVAVAVYLGLAESPEAWEVGVLLVWGLSAAAVAGFVGFLYSMSSPPASPFTVPRQILRNLLLFGAGTIGITTPYTLAATFRHGRIVSWTAIALTPISTLVIMFAALLLSETA